MCKNIIRVVCISVMSIVGILFAKELYMSHTKKELAEYQRKRDFTKTKEPKGNKKLHKSAEHIFVIHKHAASHLHYDLRIEVDGVLVSWAVPKGPSTDPEVKRLAIQTEDHPYDYATFEGVIPEGNYGAGTVMIWDNGTYHNIKKDHEGNLIPIEKCIADGEVVIWLDGHKLQGGYALIKMKQRENQWLLFKKDDEYADARRNPTSTENKSVVSGRTMAEIAADEK